MRLGNREWVGKAHLDEDQITVRGDHRIVAPLRKDASVKDGWLGVPTEEGELQLELGEQAEKWAHAICNPKTLIEKLGLKQGMKIASVGFTTVDWLGCLPHDRALEESGEYDAVLLSVGSMKDLEHVPSLAKALAPRGMIWIVFPKGRQDIKESHVFIAGKAAGLVDVKVARFNASLTGLKFVRPRKG